MRHWPHLRDGALFVGGMLGVLHETIFTHAERPTLLLLYAAMMGLPAFLRPDEDAYEEQHTRRHRNENQEDDE